MNECVKCEGYPMHIKKKIEEYYRQLYAHNLMT